MERQIGAVHNELRRATVMSKRRAADEALRPTSPGVERGRKSNRENAKHDCQFCSCLFVSPATIMGGSKILTAGGRGQPGKEGKQ